MKRLLLLALLALLAGCGGSDPAPSEDRDDDPPAPVLGGEAPAEDEAPADLGFPVFATRNTTRVAGDDPIVNAAAVAQAVYPGAAPDSRPGAVTLVDSENFEAAVSAAQLMASPLKAPILFSAEGELPEATADAIDAMEPTGSEEAGNAAVIRVGDDAAEAPGDLDATDVAGARPAIVARAVDRLATAAAGEQSQEVIVASTEDPEFAMPAAGLAVKTGAPVLWTDADDVPKETVAAIEARDRPRIYVIGPEEVVSKEAFEALEELGPTERVSGEDPIENAIAVARFADGPFGWNVVDPGHGLVFVPADEPGGAPAAAALSGSGKYGPLLLVSDPDTLPAAVEGYLLDIQPGFDTDPVRGVYNHGWLLGGEDAISVDVQARIDSLLEIQPVRGSG